MDLPEPKKRRVDGRETRSFGPCILKVLLVPQEGSIIIGRGGSNIKQLREQSQSILTLSKETLPGSEPASQVLLISGEHDNVLGVVPAILHLLEDGKMLPPETQRQLRLLVPATIVSGLIGKGGENISRIRQSYGCQCSVKPPPMATSWHAKEQVVDLVSTAEQIIAALSEIFSHISAAPDLLEHAHVSYSGKGHDSGKGHAPSVFAGKGGAGAHPGPPPGKGASYASYVPANGPAAPGPYADYGAAAGFGPNGGERCAAATAGMPPHVLAAPVAISFLIPRSSIGPVLGKGGEVLHRIRKLTNCSASIETGGDEDPTVTVRGALAAVHRCQALILERALNPTSWEQAAASHRGL